MRRQEREIRKKVKSNENMEVEQSKKNKRILKDRERKGRMKIDTNIEREGSRQNRKEEMISDRRKCFLREMNKRGKASLGGRRRVISEEVRGKSGGG